MHDEELIARIRSYLEQHRDTYTVDALRAKLVSEGLPPDAVDLAIAQVFPNAYGAPGLAAGTAAPARKKWSFLTILGLIAGSAIFNAALVFGGGWLMIVNDVLVVPVLIVGTMILVAEIVGAVLVSRRNASVTLGLVLGIVATPILVSLVLLGTCIALILAYG